MKRSKPHAKARKAKAPTTRRPPKRKRASVAEEQALGAVRHIADALASIDQGVKHACELLQQVVEATKLDDLVAVAGEQTCARCLKRFQADKATDLHRTPNFGNCWVCKPCIKQVRDGAEGIPPAAEFEATAGATDND